MSPQTTLMMLIWLALSFTLAAASTTYVNPQYLAMNIAPYGTWDQNVPSSITRAPVDEIVATMGSKGQGNRLLAFSTLIYYTQSADATPYPATMARLLNVSMETGVPIVICLDGWVWWDGLSSMWNWWDPTLPGYDPNNVHNVEWAGWDPADGIKISWRNWGSQLRVRPHPNLASPALLKMNVERMSAIVKVIGDWYTALPSEQKYLFGGLKVGSEVWIGTNYFYYKNGNSLLNANASHDPTSMLDGSVQLGYNAVRTSGLAKSGNITSYHLDTIVQNFLEPLAKLALDAGIPRYKLYAHSAFNWGDMPKNQTWNSVQAAMIPSAQPSWSIYNYAYDLTKAPILGPALQNLYNVPWAAGEFWYFSGNNGTETEQWMHGLNATIAYHNNHILDIYNWESVNASIAAALAQVLIAPLPCVVDVSLPLAAKSINATTAQLSWSTGVDVSVLTLLVSTVSAVQPGSGILISGNLFAAEVTGQISTIVSDLPSSVPIHWQLISDGCSLTQRQVSNVFTFTI